MFVVGVNDSFLKNYLIEAGVNSRENNSNQDDYYYSFIFKDKEEFLEITMPFIIQYMIDYLFNDLLKENLCEEQDKYELTSHMSPIKTEHYIKEIQKKLFHHIHSNANFDFKSFFIFTIFLERKKIKNIMYESLYSLHIPNNHYNKNKKDNQKDIIYVSVENNGDMVILDKYSNEMNRYPYRLQEDALVECLRLNAEDVVIYDPNHLLSQEVVITFKKFLGKGVVFFESEFPHSKNTNY